MISVRVWACCRREERNAIWKRSCIFLCTKAEEHFHSVCLYSSGNAKLTLHVAVAWYPPCWARAASSGDRTDPEKALSPFCQSVGIQWIICVTPGAALRQLGDRATQDSVRGNSEAGGRPRGVTGDPEVTSEGKLNVGKTKKKRRCGIRGVEHTSIRTSVCSWSVHITNSCKHT